MDRLVKPLTAVPRIETREKQDELVGEQKRRRTYKTVMSEDIALPDPTEAIDTDLSRCLIVELWRRGSVNGAAEELFDEQPYVGSGETG